MKPMWSRMALSRAEAALRARSRALTPKTECVLLDVDGARCDIPLADIKKAHVKGVVEFR